MAEQGRVITYADAGVEALREEMRRDEQHCLHRPGNRSAWRQLPSDPGSVEGIRRRSPARHRASANWAPPALPLAQPWRARARSSMRCFWISRLKRSPRSCSRPRISPTCRTGRSRRRCSFVARWARYAMPALTILILFTTGLPTLRDLKVVVPSTPYDVKGLFKTALRDPGPVVFIEHKFLYNTKGVVPEEEYLIPFGEARIVREGEDLTMVAMSRMVELAVKAAAAAGEARRFGGGHRSAHHRSLGPQERSPTPSRRPGNLW